MIKGKIEVSFPEAAMKLEPNGNAEYLVTLLKNIIEMIPDAVMVVDEEGRCILVNQAYEAISGLSAGDVLGKPATIDIAEKESILIKSLRERVAIENVLRRVGPDRREMICSAKPIFIGGKLVGSVGVMHDISEIKRLGRELEHKSRMLRNLQSKYTVDDIIGKSEKILKAKEEAMAASTFSASVLLVGESGTGKELFAHAIHNLSRRAENPLVRVNCAAISKDLVESELFGYEGGAFTGSLKSGRQGLFQQADGGTLFLDEISELTLPVQAKLLRAVQEQEIIKVGGTIPIKVDVRLIAATNKDLEQEVKNGNFRPDLFYRINVVTIRIPPLRERKEDIPVLAEYILKRYNQKYGRWVQDISDKAMEILMAYDWPGNVRELENVISRAMINMRFNEKHLTPLHLNFPVYEAKAEAKDPGSGKITLEIAGKTLEQLKRELEKQVLNYYLRREKHKTHIAQKLGITRRSLYDKLKS